MRLVIKVGTSVLADEHGKLDVSRLDCLFDDWLRSFDGELVVVSSGAIAAGVSISSGEFPETIEQKQAAAAIGQPYLMEIYRKTALRHRRLAAQILLTPDDFRNRAKYINIRNTFLNLLKQRVVPVVNENDTVAIDEIKFGDNDRLAAHVACMLEADLLVIFTNVEGIYRTDTGERIKKVENPEDVKKWAGDSKTPFTTGGMLTKIEAAKIVNAAGIDMVVAKGEPGVLKKILKGEDVGTRFVAPRKGIKSKKRWLLSLGALGGASGRIYVDEGAARALRSGKSLLPVGIVKVEGNFSKGSFVEIVYQNKVIAGGLVNYSSDEILKIKGVKSDKIEEMLGYRYSEEVVHRDNMLVTM